MNEKIKQVFTLVAGLIGVLFSTAPSLLPRTASSGEITDQIARDPLIRPADYAFAIWAPIYLGFAVFAVYQALPSQRLNPRFIQVRWWFMTSLLLNVAWTVANRNLNFELSLVFIVAMLVTALQMHRCLEIGLSKVYGLARIVRLSFSLYAGWLTVATIVDVAQVLTVRQWDGFGISSVVWGIVMLVVAAALGFLTRFRWNDPAYGAVFAWALTGIIVAETGTPAIAVTAGLLAIVFVVSTFVRWQRRTASALQKAHSA